MLEQMSQYWLWAHTQQTGRISVLGLIFYCMMVTSIVGVIYAFVRDKAPKKIIASYIVLCLVSMGNWREEMRFAPYWIVISAARFYANLTLIEHSPHWFKGPRDPDAPARRDYMWLIAVLGLAVCASVICKNR